MTAGIHIDETEAALFARAFDSGRADLPKEAAEVLLRAKFPAADLKRMLELGEMAQKGELSPQEEREAEAYDRVGLVIEILQSKARRSLAARD